MNPRGGGVSEMPSRPLAARVVPQNLPNQVTPHVELKGERFRMQRPSIIVTDFAVAGRRLFSASSAYVRPHGC